jgi:diguanylate cyclase (GGDEF)-like protein
MVGHSPSETCDEDRQIGLRLRVAMLGTAVLCAIVLAASYAGFAILVSAHQRDGAVALGIERAEIAARRLAVEALHFGQSEGPTHVFLARSAVEEARGAFLAAYGDVIEQAGPYGRTALGDVLEGRPYRLGAAVAEAARLAARVGTAPVQGDARAAARALGRTVEQRVLRGLAALGRRQRARSEAVKSRLMVAGLGLAGLAGLLLAGQWQFTWRPLMRAVERRSRALSEANARAEHSLRYDGLTGLPNRWTLAETLEAFGPRAPLGVLHVDLAGFHAINTTLGFETGQQLLGYVSRTLSRVALGSDVLARVDTDEFVLATTRRADPDQLQELAVEIIETLGQPVEIAGHAISLEAVIGIAARTALAEVPEKLLANADIARARARKEGGSVYFSIGMRERLAARRQTAQELLQALVRDEIEPYFQPQIDAASGRLTGFEALVRWRHPERGVLNPHFFLEIADQAHAGPRITAIMLKKSIAALADWRSRGFAVPRIGLNFTARELRDPRLPDILAFDLDRAGLRPSDIAVEVLESALIEDEDDPILANVAALAEAGFHIDLDDFGTGHAALSHLRHLTVSRLKIDRSLVRDLHLRPELRKMTLAMIQLARSFGIAALAEGIESENEWHLLVEMGCDDLQGFAIGKPMPAAEVAGWIEEHERRLLAGRIIAAA